MALVDYASSEEEDAAEIVSGPSKRSKTENEELPSLPATFLDLYSSTVRTSSHDDPALHGGRKRIIPHVEGNWPSHVYLEWHPSEDEVSSLSKTVEAEVRKHKTEIHSLLRNELGVSLPLHISLSRPLVLKTERKEDFLLRLQKAIDSSAIQCFSVTTTAARWHLNEDQSRCFLVMKLSSPAKDELRKLLDLCNRVAAEFEQPLLYDSGKSDRLEGSSEGCKQDQFHISIAWSLTMPNFAAGIDEIGSASESSTRELPSTPTSIQIADVKVRIGQAVHTIPLRRSSKLRHSLFQ